MGTLIFASEYFGRFRLLYNLSRPHFSIELSAFADWIGRDLTNPQAPPSHMAAFSINIRVSLPSESLDCEVGSPNFPIRSALVVFPFSICGITSGIFVVRVETLPDGSNVTQPPSTKTRPTDNVTFSIAMDKSHQTKQSDTASTKSLLDDRFWY